jgi:hypothetical protein
MPLRAGVEQVHGARRPLARDLDPVTWFLSSSGMSKVASARVSPAPNVNGASPRRWPRADMACSVPARGPPSGRSTCASRRPPAATPATAPSASWPGRVSTTESLPPARLESLSAKSRAAPSWSMPSASQTMEATPAPVSAVAIACAVAVRSGEKGWGCTAAAVERAAAGASIFKVMALAALAVGRDEDGAALAFGFRDQPLDHECARAPLRGGGPAVVDDQDDGAGAGERLLAVGIEHGLGQRQDHQRGSQHADQREPPGGLRRRLLAVLDADEDAGRRELDAAWPRRNGAQQPPDDRQGQQTRQQPWAEEGDGAERHGVPPAPVAGADVCVFQR